VSAEGSKEILRGNGIQQARADSALVPRRAVRSYVSSFRLLRRAARVEQGSPSARFDVFGLHCQ
jgi:hypothetical protein